MRFGMPKWNAIAPHLHENLLTVARAYAAERGLTLAAVSRRCHGDSRTLGNIERGAGSMTLPKLDEVMEWFCRDGNWPKSLRLDGIWAVPRATKRNGGNRVQSRRRGRVR